MSKIEAGRITLHQKTCDLEHLLNELYNLFALKAQQKGLQVTFERAENLPRYIHTDDVKLRQILINLLSNAMKFTEAGSVTVRVRSHRLNDLPTFTPSQEGKKDHDDAFTTNLHFEVEDTGHGLAPDEIETIFEAFTQTGTGIESKQGTGLGLPISRKFVQLMGGDMIVESEVGKGSTFSFDIQVGLVEPTSIAEQHPLTVKRVVAIEPGQPRYRILVVDDEPDNRTLLIKLLEPFGFELREASNGQEALMIWKEWQPHLIWMDIRIPGLNGYEATKQIKSAIRNPQSEIQPVIIAMSASSLEEEQSMAMSNGCDDFLRKPFREAAIFDLMNEHLGVRFVYDDKEKGAGVKWETAEKGTLTPMAIDSLPDDILTRLEHAALTTDLTTIESLIAEIRAIDGTIAERLATLAHQFEYKKILAMICKTD